MRLNHLLFIGLGVILLFGAMFLPLTTYSETSIDRGSEVNVSSENISKEPLLGINETESIAGGANNQTLVIVENPQSLSQNTTVSLSNDIANWSLQNGNLSRTVVLSENQSERFAVDVGTVSQDTTANYTITSTGGLFTLQTTKSVNVTKSDSGDRGIQ